MGLKGNGTIPAVYSARIELAKHAGMAVMELLKKNIRPRDIITKEALMNALTVDMALGCSTNSMLHLPAIAHEAGVDLNMELVNEMSKRTPNLCHLAPAGPTYMEDLNEAGGVYAVMNELSKKNLLNLDCMTVTGKTVGENLKKVDYAYDRRVIRSIDDPISPVGGMCILKGNLAPNGAVIKRSAATERLLHHRGRAKVFDDLSVAEKWLADENSDVDENTVIVLRGYGPKGAPGMPEFGNYLPVPPALHKKGIDDYLRVTDSRMSGGCFGSIILHVSPEAEEGGPLAAVRDGDIIHVEADENLIEVEISDEEIARRLKDFKPKGHPDIKRGFVRNFIDHVLQADQGCDLDYLRYVEEG